MKSIKKNKNIIIGIIIGLFIGLSVTVSAATLIASDNVTYSNSNTSATEVKSALDDLFSKNNTLKNGWTLSNDANNNKVLDIGDEICYDTECFYIYYVGSTYYKLIAKYNLYAGGSRNSSSAAYIPYVDATLKQNSFMLGAKTNNAFYEGVVGFSDDLKNSSFDTELYYDGSYIESLVYDYYDKWMTGSKVYYPDLISVEELEKLGCSLSNYTCENAPFFVTSSVYWTKTIAETYAAWSVYGESLSHSIEGDIDTGCRPVFTINKSDL